MTADRHLPLPSRRPRPRASRPTLAALAALVLATGGLVPAVTSPSTASAAAPATVTAAQLPVASALGPLTPKDVVYQIVTDRFSDGLPGNNVPPGSDPRMFDDANRDGRGDGRDLKLYQGGDFQGIVDRIPYLSGMGITAVWISAPYANRDTIIEDQQPDGSVDRWTSFHGYHVRNYFATNEHFGSLAQFEQLRDALHANGIKLVIDFVSNHTSRWQNPTRGLVAEDGRLYEPDRDASGRYVFGPAGEPVDANGDGRVENLLADPHADTRGWFHGLGDRGSDSTPFGFRHKELGSLADLSQENAEVVSHLEQAATFWKARGVDGFRHDATLHMNPAFTKGLRDAIDSAPGGPVSHVGEFFIGRPDPKYDEYRTFPDRTGVNNLDFEYYRASTNAFGSFSEPMSAFGDMMLKTSQDYTYEHQAVTFLDNHDVTRFRYVQPNDRPYHAALATMLTARGTPNIYYGTEQYLSSADASDIAGRVFMDRAQSYDRTTTAYRTIQRLSSLRRANDALAYGQTAVLHSTADTLVFSRTFFDKRVVVAVNRQPDRSTTVPALSSPLPAGTYADQLGGLLGGAGTTVSGGTLPSFELSGGEVSVWSSNPAASTGTPRIGDVVSTTGRAGSTVVVTGTGLGGSPAATIGGVAARVTSSSDTRLTLVVPAGAAPGVRDLVVTKGSTTSNAFRFEVLGGDQVQVVFTVEARTSPGQTIHVVGSVSELGSWQPAAGTEAMMTPDHPRWFLPVSVPRGSTFEFKFVRRDPSGAVVWESGPNRTFTAPSSPTGVANTPVYRFS